MILLTEHTEVGQMDKDYLSDLMNQTTLDERQKKLYRLKIWICDSPLDLEELELLFYNNRIDDKDRISMGFNY